MTREEALEMYAANQPRLLEAKKVYEDLLREQGNLKAVALAEKIPGKTRKDRALSTAAGAQDARFLKAISEFGGRITLAEIGQLLSMTKTGAYYPLERLVKQGYLRKFFSEKGLKVPPHCIYELAVTTDNGKEE